MLTGDADLQTAIRAMREGAFDYISKPVGLADLMIHVKRALSKPESTEGHRWTA